MQISTPYLQKVNQNEVRGAYKIRAASGAE